jgi:hypothetical protein
MIRKDCVFIRVMQVEPVDPETGPTKAWFPGAEDWACKSLGQRMQWNTVPCSGQPSKPSDRVAQSTVSCLSFKELDN